MPEVLEGRGAAGKRGACRVAQAVQEDLQVPVDELVEFEADGARERAGELGDTEEVVADADVGAQLPGGVGACA